MPNLIELEHLVDALKGFRRPLREGRQAVVNIIEPVGLLHQTKDPNTRFAEVLALVIRTTKINDDPVKVEVKIDRQADKVEEKIVDISCRCPAGSSKEHCCKHAVAVLIYLEKNDESKLEKLTCTDIEQVWGNIAEETLTRFHPIPLHEFCHVKKSPSVYKRPVLEVTSELAKEFRSLLLKAQPNSEASLFMSGVRHRPLPQVTEAPTPNNALLTVIEHALSNPHYILKRMAEVTEKLYTECSPQEKKFYDENIRVTREEAVQMCVDTDGQDNDLWTLFRYGRFTGSKIYEMFTYSKNNNPNWDSKFEKTFQSSSFSTKAMQDGLMYEPDAKDKYEEKENKKVATTGIIVHPSVPWLGFSPDGVIFFEDKPDKLWENKTPKCGNSKQVTASDIARLYTSAMSAGKLKQKHKFYGQVQLGMLMTAVNMCDFTLYCIGVDDLYINTVVLNETFCIDMLQRTAEVYFKKCLPWLRAHPHEPGH